MTVESPWLPRATCDASCVAAGGAPSGGPVVVAVRVAVRATLAVILLSAVPLLAIPMPGRSHVQRGYCRLMLRCARRANHGVRRAYSQPAWRAGGQRPRVLGRHILDRRGDARLLRRQGRHDQLARPRHRRPIHEGHPDRTGQPAPAARGRGRWWPPGFAQDRPSWPSPRAPPGAAWPTGRSGRRCSRPPSTPGRPVQPLRLTYHHRDGSRRPSPPISATTPCRVDPPAGHRAPHRRPRPGRIAAVAGRRPARPGRPLRDGGARGRRATGTRARAGRLSADSGRPLSGGYPGTVMATDTRPDATSRKRLIAGLPRSRRHHPDASRRHRGDDGCAGAPSATPRRCTPPAGRRGGGSRSPGRRIADTAGRAPVRGDLHRGRHRERQPGRQGHLLGAPRRRAAPSAHRHHRRRTPCRARRGRTGSSSTKAPR